MAFRQILSETEAFEKVKDFANDARGHRWMAVFWRVTEAEQKGEPNKLELLGKVTWMFPTGDYEKAAEMLKKLFEEETSPKAIAVPEPLKTADFLRRAPEVDDVEIDKLFNPEVLEGKE